MFSAYFKKLQDYPSFRFIVEVSALTLVSRYLLVVPVVILLTIFNVDTGTPNMDVYKVGQDPFWLFIDLVLLGPLLETWLLQWLPLRVLRLIRIPETLSIWITTIVFAFLHLETGLVNFIGTLPIGYLLVWSYVVRQKKSGWKAFWIVFAIHALTNLFPFFIYVLELLGDK